MKKKIMRIFCCIMATLFLSIPGMAYATEAGNTPIDVVQNYDVQILSTDVKHNRSLAKVTTHTANGEITNNGYEISLRVKALAKSDAQLYFTANVASKISKYICNDS